MLSHLLLWLAALPPSVATAILAMLPIAELRVSIPVALTAYQLTPVAAFVYSVIGNIIPVFFIIPLLGPISSFLMKRSKIAERFFAWLFDRTRRKFTGNYQKYGSLALVVFVAIPLPVTGAWTGAVAAWLFGIPYRRAVWLILLGVIGAGLIVSAISLGFLSSLAFLLK
jgi:uncharacterized membrane protein